MKYDYLVVGAGLFGAVFTYEAKKRGKSVLVIDRREHIAGNSIIISTLRWLSIKTSFITCLLT